MESVGSKRSTEMKGFLFYLTVVLVVLVSGCQKVEPFELPVRDLEVAWEPLDATLPLLPSPKKLDETDQPLRLTGKVGIASDDPALAEDLIEELQTWWGVEGQAVDQADPICRIVLTLGAPTPAQGYVLEVGQERVKVRGADRAGLMYGTATLKQLFFWDDGLAVRGVNIEDWPSLEWRGVHLHTGAGSGPTHRRLIKQVLAPLKMNKLVVEAQYAQWESHPELWVPALSIPLSELKKTAQEARAHGVEPIPLIQTLSHNQWMFENEQNEELKAGGLDYLFNPDKEKSWEVVFDIYGEALETFEAQTLHVGHDEVRSLRGIFPGSDRHVTKVVEESVLRVYTWLSERKVKTMMWHDTMVHRSESAQVGLAPSPEHGAQLRQALPKDILVVDWQYGPYGWNLEFPEIGILVKDGFTTVGAAWDSPERTRLFAAELVEQGGSGLLQTTWPGRVLSDAVVEGYEHHQFSGIVDAAEAAWTGGEGEKVSPLAFRRFWSRRPHGESEPRKGFSLDLSHVGENGEPDLPAQVTGAEFAFRTSAGVNLDKWGANLPEKPLEGLAFLWYTASAPETPGEVAKLTVRYRGGDSESVPVRYGKEVSSRDSERPSFLGPEAWRGPDGKTRLWRWFWKNPHPGKSVESFVLEQAEPSLGLTVLGVTGMELP
jgi:hypothetical protein